MARADDEVEAVEVELLDGRRKERQVHPVELLDERQALHERGVRAGRSIVGDTDPRT